MQYSCYAAMFDTGTNAAIVPESLSQASTQPLCRNAWLVHSKQQRKWS